MRIGPDHLLIDALALFRKMLAARSRYARGPWFNSLRIDPHIPNIVSERDERSHNRLRSKLSASVSHPMVSHSGNTNVKVTVQ